VGRHRVPGSQPHALKPGTAVEATGFPSRDGLRIDLKYAVARAIPDDAADRGGPAPPVLRTIKSVRELTPARAATGLPVRVRESSLLWIRSGSNSYLQDATEGIYVKYSGVPNLEAGTRVTLAGISGAGAFAPVIVAPHIRMEGAGAVACSVSGHRRSRGLRGPGFAAM